MPHLVIPTEGGVRVLRICPKCGREAGREYTIGITACQEGFLYTYWMECESCGNRWQAVQIRKA
jgi:DNA-directed RNA polymerase subunit M/transcription elongation factor TFIIS